MEPALIRKYLVYRRKKAKQGVRASPRVNDSGVNLVDMQSNDCWSIAFLLLLTHDPRFAFCYTYKKENEDNCPIRFDRSVFVKLFRKVLRKFKADRSFCYVLGRLCGFYRFHGKTNEPSENEPEEILEPVEYNQRDLKFFVWLLTYARFPEEKVIKFEDGGSVREIDEYATMASNASLYESEEEKQLESQVKQFMTDKQILLTLDQNNRIIENVVDKESREPEIAPFRPTLYEEPTYSFFEQKSHIQAQKQVKKEAPKKQPVQKMQMMSQFAYQNPAQAENTKLLYKLSQEDGDWENEPDESHFSIDHVTSTNAMKDVKISKIKDKLTNIPAILGLFEPPRNGPSKPARMLPPPPKTGKNPKFAIKPVEQQSQEQTTNEAVETLNPRIIKSKSRRRTTRKENQPTSNQYKEKVMASLNRVSQRQLHVTNLDELDQQSQTTRERDENNHQDGQQNNCRCKLCTKASSRIRWKPKVIRPPLAQFDTKKSVEELKKDRLESRIKRTPRVKYQEPKYEDPYFKQGKDVSKKMKMTRGRNETKDFERVSRHETSHYKTSKFRRLQMEMKKRNKSSGRK